MRRVLDILIGTVGGVLLLPVAITVGVTILAAMGRPILFRQWRSGLGGRPFRIVKFRTMSDAQNGMSQLLPDDLRLGTLGRGLRRLRLDELPQLLHLVAGEMSLIGPRPLLPETVAAMAMRGQLRGRVRPGLTGWAQVNGNTELSDAEKLALDLWYIEHRSLGLDAAIVLRTAWTVVVGTRRNEPEIERALEHAGRAGRHS